MIEYIYTITHLSSGKLYVGRTNDPKGRRSHHFGLLRKNKHGNPKLQRAYNKYGEEDFVFEVVDECDSAKIYDLELQWFGKYNNDLNILYNCHVKSIGGPDKDIRSRMDKFVSDYMADPDAVIANRDSYGIAHKSFAKYLPEYDMTLEDIYQTKWRDVSIEKAKLAYEYKMENRCTVMETLKYAEASVTTFYKYVDEWRANDSRPFNSEEVAKCVVLEMQDGMSMNKACKKWRISKDSVKKYCPEWINYKQNQKEK